MDGYLVGGDLVREWTPARIAAEIVATGHHIRAAFRRGDTERALTLISRVIGLRVCSGEIMVALKSPRQDQQGQQQRPPAVCLAAREVGDRTPPPAFSRLASRTHSRRAR